MLDEKDLHAYQHRAVEHIMSVPKCALFLEMGLGKTVSSLTAVNKLLFEELDVESVLVIAPKRVAESVWKQEAAKWGHLKHLEISIVAGKVRHRKTALKVKADIYVIGRDNVQWLCAQYGGSKLPFDMAVIDESSSFKNHQSKRFKALRLIHFDRIVELTGTPTPKGLIDLWAQLYLLDKGKRLGKTISEFRRNFFNPGAMKDHVVYNYRLKNKRCADAIHRRVSDICMSMKAKDYLDLPGRREQEIFLDMPTDLKEKYAYFEKEKVLELVEELGDDPITAANAAGLNTKLQQFANGAVYDEDKNYHIVHDIKLEALEEIVEAANGKPILIGYAFKSDAERIAKKLKKYKPRKMETDKDIRDWNAGKIQVMYMHPASGGHGLNLQDGGHVIVWFGHTWALELLQQFNARLDRQGQKFMVVIKKLIMRGTVDEKILASNVSKAKGQSALMEAVKALIQKYKVD